MGRMNLVVHEVQSWCPKEDLELWKDPTSVLVLIVSGVPNLNSKDSKNQKAVGPKEVFGSMCVEEGSSFRIKVVLSGRRWAGLLSTPLFSPLGKSI